MALLLFYIPRKSEKAKLARILHLIENKLIDSLRLERVQSFHGKIQGTGEYKLILRIFNRDQEEEIVYKKQFFTIIAMAIFTVLIGVIAVQASPTFRVITDLIILFGEIWINRGTITITTVITILITMPIVTVLKSAINAHMLAIGPNL